MVTDRTSALDDALGRIESKTRAARVYSILLTFIPIIAAVVFLFVVRGEVRKAQSARDLAAEESERLLKANKETEQRLSDTKSAIATALTILENTASDTKLPGNVRRAVDDSRKNISKVNEVLAEAKEKLGRAVRSPAPDVVPTIMIEIADLRQMDKARDAQKKLEEQGFTVDIFQIPVPPPRTTQVRYFYNDESSEAEKIVQVLRDLNIKVVKAIYFEGYEQNAHVREYEVRFSAAALN